MDDPARDRARPGWRRHDRRACVLCDVTTRTIRRDLQALEEAGFPDLRRSLARRWTDAVDDQRPGVQGAVRRTDLVGAVRAALQPDAARIARRHSVPRRTRERVRQARRLADAAHAAVSRSAAARHRLQARPAAPAPGDDDGRQQQIIARALEATLHHRQATLTYYSRSSERTKSYLVHPVSPGLRAGRALSAGARAGIQRGADVRRRAHRRDHAARRALHAGWTTCPTRRFRTRWASTRVRPRRSRSSSNPRWPTTCARGSGTSRRSGRMSADGRLVLTLDVCIDQALRSWILSFGPFARVTAPESLAREIAGQIEQARARYARTASSATLIRHGTRRRRWRWRGARRDGVRRRAASLPCCLILRQSSGQPAASTRCRRSPSRSRRAVSARRSGTRPGAPPSSRRALSRGRADRPVV